MSVINPTTVEIGNTRYITNGNITFKEGDKFHRAETLFSLKDYGNVIVNGGNKTFIDSFKKVIAKAAAEAK